ncbi:sugar transferase [Marinobacter sp. F4206]|uniref:sugar transferase n=1 Tax=Marinobacter sp. F4206 TaxID=2861777 RepID=UPI001C5F5E42|nr:sugar transferase [Marinobacter sp. F4206]MBW4933792.1 sugar transferase [Marinobacter sp. F4206]
MLRTLDICFAAAGLLVGLPVVAVLMLVGYWDTGSPLFRQERIGRHKKPFILMKFRTMRQGTASVASHLAPEAAITSFGGFLRRTKLDELPQLWNVLKGEMSLVGPRPCLASQSELIEARDMFGVFEFAPGITGLGQVNGIDMSTPALLAQTDAEMLQDLTVRRYFGYLLMTITGKGSGDGVRRFKN